MHEIRVRYTKEEVGGSFTGGKQISIKPESNYIKLYKILTPLSTKNFKTMSLWVFIFI